MKFLVILGIAGVALWGIYSCFGNVIHPKPVAHAPVNLPPSPFPKAAAETGPPPLLAALPMPAPGADHARPYVGCHRLYRFLNRDVPGAPFDRVQNNAGKPDEHGVEISVDKGANAWVIRGPIVEVEQMMSIAQGLDLEQDQLDLDFVLVALSEDYVRSWGVTALFKDGASYLSAFNLDVSGLSLTLSHGASSITFNAQDSNTFARVVSSPVVRAVTGEKWEFSADTQVPVPTLQRSEGVVSTAYEYRKVGLGLSGTIARAPRGQYRMHLEQRNGTVDTPGKDSTVPPQLREQVLQTSAVLDVARWSCVGGVRSWQSETEKGFFGKSVKETQELLLVFCRPRFQLEAVPRALPADSTPDSTLTHLRPFGPDPLTEPGSPLLPPKDWKRRQFPDGIEPKGLPIQSFGPRAK